MTKLRPAVLVFFLPWIFAVPLTQAAPPEAPRCDKPEAEAAFSQGFDHYSRRFWKAAIPGLEEAAGLCPKPDGPWMISLHGFGQAPYLPFFYLGRCHFELKEHPDALRQFHLSRCFDEPARGKSKMADLDSMTGTCLKNIRSPQQKHPFFSEGLAAFEQEEWEKSAKRMWDSLQAQPKEGETIVSNGRWTAVYLPRFQLAKALYKLGCQRQACELLQTELIEQVDPRVTLERKEMLDLRAACADQNRRAQADTMACRQWDCWLKAVEKEPR